jgi:hypothetical protein
MGGSSGAGTDFLSEAHEFTQQVDHVVKKMKYMDWISCLQTLNYLVKKGCLWMEYSV